MKKNTLVAAAVLFSVLLLLPIALANVYVPPGPGGSMDAWISPTLIVLDKQDVVPAPIGWMYSEGPMYDNVAQKEYSKIEMTLPIIVGKTLVHYSTKVVVFGWIPKLVVSPDQVPPPVELKITWNGIPYLVTLTLPGTQVVGFDYPPKVYPDQAKPYEFAWNQKSPLKDACYNIWVGDIDNVRSQLSFALPNMDFPFGYFFWYIFHPNAGDWISFDCQPGKTAHPPTYDITALFEYSTSQIWFNHVCFDVRFLEVHKTITPNPVINDRTTKRVLDKISIKNLGKVPATKIDIFQTFPSSHEVDVNPDYGSAKAKIFDADGNLKVGPLSLTGFGSAWPYMMPAPFDTLLAGEELVITMSMDVSMAEGWGGTLVFHLVVSAAEIPPWKYPRSMDGLIVLPNIGPLEYMWEGMELFDLGGGQGLFTMVPEWPVPTPIINKQAPPVPTVQMKLDPVPVDLDGDGEITGLDVAIVRQAVVGLIPYEIEMDINVNGKIDTQDLAAYKLVAKG